jgi:hypothetical protein
MDPKTESQARPPVKVSFAYPTTTPDGALKGPSDRPIYPAVRLSWYDRVLAWLLLRMSRALTRTPGDGTV